MKSALRTLVFSTVVGLAGLVFLYPGMLYGVLFEYPLPVIAEVPDFKLTERSGRPLARADLAGKVWIADFIFTRCGGPCPKMTANMRRLEQELGGEADLRLVSFTLDPAFDTPEVLARYADAHAAPKDRWLFATGLRPALVRLSVEGFKLGAEDEAAGGEPIHSTRFVLVDRAGRIRGYYDGEDPDGQAVRRLAADTRALLAAPATP